MERVHIDKDSFAAVPVEDGREECARCGCLGKVKYLAVERPVLNPATLEMESGSWEDPFCMECVGIIAEDKEG